MALAKLHPQLIFTIQDMDAQIEEAKKVGNIPSA
jgi:hypothetical protein